MAKHLNDHEKLGSGAYFRAVAGYVLGRPDVVDEATSVILAVCMPVYVSGGGEVQVYRTELGGGTVASTIHRGPYDEIRPACHPLAGWITDHGHEMTGPPREAYLNDPSEVSPHELLTEVAWPIR